MPILLSSGATVTWAHYSITKGDQMLALKALGYTVRLGLLFTGLQGIEYYVTPFTIIIGFLYMAQLSF